MFLDKRLLQHALTRERDILVGGVITDILASPGVITDILAGVALGQV